MKISGELKNKLDECRSLTDTLERRLAIASIITEAFKENQLSVPVLVGGGAVEVYTGGEYATHDTDFIADLDGLEYALMESLGYKRVLGDKNLYHKELESLVEFPKGPLAGNQERIFTYQCESTNLPVYIISPEDLILDRIESFYATNDGKSKEWAERLLTGMYEYLDWSYFHKESYARGIGELAEKLQRKSKGYRKAFLKMNDSIIPTKNMKMF